MKITVSVEKKLCEKVITKTANIEVPDFDNFVPPTPEMERLGNIVSVLLFQLVAKKEAGG